MARVLKPGGRIALSVDSLLPENSTQSFREWHKRRHFVTHYFSQDTLTTALRNAGFRSDAEPTVHLFRSQAAARLRQNFILSPRLWLPLFHAFYLAARFADRMVTTLTDKSLLHRFALIFPRRRKVEDISVGTRLCRYVTASCLAELGHEVVGIEPNLSKVRMLNTGQSPVKEPGLDSWSARPSRR
jgi:hypothetical protein